MSIEDNEQPQHYDPYNRQHVTEMLESYAETVEAHIHKALAESNTGFAEVKERFSEQDFSEIGTEIYDALMEIDDTPIAQIVNGAVYGVTQQSVEIFSAIYDRVAERFGETLTTTINDTAAFNHMVESVLKDIQLDADHDVFEGVRSRGASAKNYLNIQNDRSPEASLQERSQGMER